MGLLDLPAEIRLKILEDDDLTMDDDKSLRLTTRVFYPSSTSAIFRQISLSKTNKDWAAFRNIASHPHLAECVRGVVWYELIEDHRILCHSQGMQEGCWCEEKAGEEFLVTAHELAPLAKDLFWLTPEICDASDGAELLDLKNQFLSLIDLLPKLESFVSRPMPPRYVLSNGPYTFTAQLFYRSLGLTGPGYSRHSISSGFFHFLMPAMIQRSSKVRRLHFIDHPSRSAIYNFTDPESPAFENLTDINLCFSVIRNSADLMSSLRRARSLERFRFCIDRWPGNTVAVETMLALFPTSSTRYWPRITTLELVMVSTNPIKHLYSQPDEAVQVAGEVWRAFLDFLGAHSPTLRSLTLHECDVYRDIIEQMAGLPELNLKSFRVIAPEEGETEWVNEQELVDFVNGVDKSGQCIEHVQEDMDINTFSTAANVMQKDQGPLSCEVGNNAVHPAVNDYNAFRPRLDSSYGESAYAHDKREMGAPAWKFSRVDNDVYVWPTDDTDSHDTRTWQFTHRSGAVALGDEPLEFFSDWDSDSESGDVAEAVPVLGAFQRSTISRWELPVGGNIPEGATKYNHEEYAEFGATALTSDLL